MALLLFMLVAVALVPGALFGTEVPWVHDLRHHHDPWRAWAAAAWRRGEVPWWTPGAGMGFPLLAAGEGGFLYPPTMLLYVVAPDARALGWSLLLHTAGAGLGVWRYLRAVGLRQAPALLGGGAWAASGWMVAHGIYPGMHAGWSWMGWALAATVLGRGAGLALAVGMMGLAGHPQGAAFGGLVVGAHALATRGGALGPRRWVLAAGVGLFVASPQLVATWQLAQEGLRQGGLDPAAAREGAMAWAELPRLFLSGHLGTERPGDVPLSYEHRGGSYVGFAPASWETTSHVGVAVAVLAALGLARGGRAAWGWALLAITGILVATGGPAWSLLRHLPGMDGFRFPVRALVATCLAVPILAAHGLDRMMGARTLGAGAVAPATPPGPAAVKVRAGWVAALVVASLGWGLAGIGHLALPTLRPGLAARLAAAAGPAGPSRAEEPTQSTPTTRGAAADGEGTRAAPLLRPDAAQGSALLAASAPAMSLPTPAGRAARAEGLLDDLARSLDPLGSRVLVPVGVLLAAAVLLRVAARGREGLATAGFLALALGELVATWTGTLAGVPAAATRVVPAWMRAIGAPSGGRVAIVDRRVPVTKDTVLGSASLGLLYGVSEVFVPSPLRLPRVEALLALSGLGVTTTGDASVPAWARGRAVARRMSVGRVVSLHALPGARGHDGVYVLEDTAALPRARVHPCAEVLPDADAVVAALRELPALADPFSTVFLEAPEGAAGPTCDSTTPVRAASLVVDAATRTVVRASGPGWLVLADTLLPGWSAEVDGRSAPLRHADLAFRAVALGPGDHEVVFRYDAGLPARLLPWAAVGLGLVGAWTLAGARPGAGAPRDT